MWKYIEFSPSLNDNVYQHQIDSILIGSGAHIQRGSGDIRKLLTVIN